MLHHQSWLLVLTFYQAWVMPVVMGKGKALGEACVKYDDCGDYPKSMILCTQNVCQCWSTMYYEESKGMCVSHIGEKCDASEPTDAIKLEFKCGENAHCLPSLRDKFGRCRCNSGYKLSEERKCVYMSNSRLNGNANVNHPNHPKGTHGTGEDSKNFDSSHQIVSFPFSSANSKSRTSSASKDSLQSHMFTIIIILLCVLSSRMLYL